MADWLDDLESDLRKKVNRRDTFDKLLELPQEMNERVSWCVAKMAQNKAAPQGSLELLIQFSKDDDPQVRENGIWGIGEIAGMNVFHEECIERTEELLRDDDKMVRGMAAWAAGRLLKKQNRSSDEVIRLLKDLLNDPSEYVRKAAAFALDNATADQ